MKLGRLIRLRKEVTKRAKELREKNYSYKKIARILKREGVVNRDGKPYAKGTLNVYVLDSRGGSKYRTFGKNIKRPAKHTHTNGTTQYAQQTTDLPYGGKIVYAAKEDSLLSVVQDGISILKRLETVLNRKSN